MHLITRARAAWSRRGHGRLDELERTIGLQRAVRGLPHEVVELGDVLDHHPDGVERAWGWRTGHHGEPP